jgi:hypothetical protein
MEGVPPEVFELSQLSAARATLELGLRPVGRGVVEVASEPSQGLIDPGIRCT